MPENENMVNEAQQGNVYTLDDAFAAAQQRVLEEDTPAAETEKTSEAQHKADGTSAEAEYAPTGEADGNASDVNNNPATSGLEQRLAALEQALAQSQQINAQYQQQLAAMQQQTQAEQKEAAEAVIESVLVPPELDFNAMMYADEDTQKQMSSEYTQKMAEYAMQMAKKEFQPLVDEYNRKAADAERVKVLDSFRNSKDTPDFAGREGSMQYIIDNHPNMKQLPLREQYEMAYLISRGVDSMKNQNAPQMQVSVDDEVARISQNPEIMRKLSELRAREAAEKQSNVPPAFIASQGNARVSANVPERPESFDDAYAMAKKRIAEV